MQPYRIWEQIWVSGVIFYSKPGEIPNVKKQCSEWVLCLDEVLSIFTRDGLKVGSKYEKKGQCMVSGLWLRELRGKLMGELGFLSAQPEIVKRQDWQEWRCWAPFDLPWANKPPLSWWWERGGSAPGSGKSISSGGQGATEVNCG